MILKSHSLSLKHYIILCLIALILVPVLHLVLPAPAIDPLPPVATQLKKSNSHTTVQKVNGTGLTIPVTVSSWQLDPEDETHRQFGPLQLNYALDLASSHKDFGGISGLSLISEMEKTLTFRAVTDAGHIFNISVSEQKSLPSVSVTNFRPVLSKGQSKGQKKSDSDAESVTVMPYGFDMITFERAHRIMLGDIRIQNPAGLANLPNNGGLEAAGRLADGRLILLAEDQFDGESAHPLWISTAPLKEGQVTLDYVRFNYQTPKDHRPTDLAPLSDGSVLILHRHYTPLQGVSIVVSKLSADSLRAAEPGDLLVPNDIISLPNRLNLDNFEGLAVLEKPDHIRLFMISDDNFRRAQKSLLISFTLPK